MLAARRDLEQVHDQDVPVLLASVGLPQPGRSQPTDPPEGADNQNQDKEPCKVDMNLDSTTRQLLHFIDGYNHVLKIAADSNVEKSLVKSCIQNLVSCGVITLIPVLNFRNTYRATPNFNRLLNDRQLQESCLKFIIKTPDSTDRPSLTGVFEVLSTLQQGASLWTVCDRYAGPSSQALDIRRLIVFAELHDLLECHKKFPVYLPNPVRRKGLASRIDSMMGI